MANPEVASKGAQGGLFLLAGLCFLLPFEGVRIVYEAGGERFESFRPAGVQLNVNKKVSRPVAGRLQRVCGGRVEALR